MSAPRPIVQETSDPTLNGSPQQSNCQPRVNTRPDKITAMKAILAA
jgi:hypothetical protein